MTHPPHPFPIGSFTLSGADQAPRVSSTSPADGASNVAPDISIQVNFSEPVSVTPSTWFSIDCGISGLVTATESTADNVQYDLVPAADLAQGESCTVTINASDVSDLDSEDPPDNPAADFIFSFTVASAEPTGVVINEIHADPDSAAGDANNDGTPQFSDDEFVEIVNTSGADLDLSNWTLSDGASLRHTFPAGTVVADQCAIVVFGGGTPTGSFGGASAQTASSGALGLNNSGDTITLADTAGGLLVVSYGGEGGDNQSLTRSPDLTGDFVQHTTLGPALFSPGTQLDGASFAGCESEPDPVVSTYDIQGSDVSSPLVGQNVIVEGVVTGDFQDNDGDTQSNLRGFYIQDASGDGDATTSDGLFVFDGSNPSTPVSVGDLVRVSGSVVEFFGETQVSAQAVEVIGSGSVPATPINLPATNVLSNADGDLIPDLEAFEGMLVSFPDALSATELRNLDRFGEVRLSQGGRLFQFTNSNSPSVGGFNDHLADVASRSIFLDDGLSIQNPDPIRYPAPGLPNNTGAFLRIGDTVSGLTGNLRFSRGSGGSGDEAYRLMPTIDPAFASGNPRPNTAPNFNAGLRVASFNVLNYFTTIDNGNPICGAGGNLGCRGADSQEELDRQREKLLTSLIALNADILGLIEIENNATASLQDIVDGVNGLLGGDVYDYVDTGTIGTDAIKVGFIYNTDSVEAIGGFAVLDSSVDPNFIDNLNRPVLAQTFRDNDTGGEMTVLVNHLKSKGSDCDDVGDPNLGDGQGNCNLTRTKAAQAMADWIQTDPTGVGDEDYLIIGDLNAYLEEDPVVALESAGLVNLLDQFVGSEAYSFVFDGQAGALDHGFATPALADQIVGTEEWHINADEADAIDYNLDFGRNPNIFDGGIEFRVSDHDPMIIGLNLVSDILGDVDQDGDIDLRDLTGVLRALFSREGQRRYNPLADLDSNGRVNLNDVAIWWRLFREWQSQN